MKPINTARSILIPALLLALTACGKKDDPSKAGAGAPPPSMVSVITVAPEQVSNITELPGRVEAVRTAEVRARVGGIIQKRYFTEGSEVQAGQQLYSTRRDLAKARYDTLVSGLRLKAAAGSLSQDDISQLNLLLTSR